METEIIRADAAQSTDSIVIMDYDPFSLKEYGDLENLSGILTTVTKILEIVKIVMEQKGFKGTGINVNVNVAPRAVKLLT